MGRVTYVHHYVRFFSFIIAHPLPNFAMSPQLPTLYFSVLMFAHLVDHFVFSAKRWSERVKWVVFGILVAILVGSFWWFKGIAFGIEGPINNHWGLRWRQVRLSSALDDAVQSAHLPGSELEYLRIIPHLRALFSSST